jgi:ribosomal protein S18 acetylase RimI-like enzyme
MTTDPEADRLAIVPAAPEQAVEALRLVFRDLASEARECYVSALTEQIASDAVGAEGLWLARRAGRLAGAVLAQSQAGRMAVVWPPRLVAHEPAATAGLLLERALQWLAGQGVRMAHALLETVTETDDAVLRAGGFAPLAELVYLGSERTDFPERCPEGPIRFEPYCPANHDRLVRAVEASYEETLDCPELNGIRDTADVLAGYRATGVFDPARWLIARSGNEDVGCLLLADHPQEETWELVYMGLSVEARRRGWGRQIARHAQWLAGQAGRPRLLVAVDAANAPALRVYAAVGFQVWDRRRVYLKTLHDVATAD